MNNKHSLQGRASAPGCLPKALWTARRPGHQLTLLALGIILLTLSFRLQAPGQSFSIDWYKVSGGGGTSTNGLFSLNGTIGQPDAGAAMSGGDFSLVGGFWALNATQTPGLPRLTIRLAAPNAVVVSWPNLGSYALQTNDNLATTNWADYPGSILLQNGTNSVTITPPVGNLFFRLR
jgi:hypothetical protein